MDFDAIISSLPVACGFLCLSIAINFFRKTEFLSKKLRYSILMGGIFAMFWNFGLAWYSFSYDFEIAKYGVYLVIWGFDAFYIFIVYFVSEYIGLNKKSFYLFLILGIVLTILDGILFGMGDVHDYVRVGNRTAYLTRNCWQTYYHFIYIMLFAVVWNIQIFIFTRNQPYRRTREFSAKSVIAMWILFILSIPDTFFPFLQIPSIPISGIGVTFSYFALCRLILKMNLFSISRDNLAKYLYKNPNMGIMIFDLDWKLSISNEFAENLLGFKFDKSLTLKDILQVTDENIKYIIEEKDISDHIKSVNNDVPVGIVCTVAKDKYGDAFCYIILASDMTYEEEKDKLEKAEIRKQQIDKMLIQIVEALGSTIDAKDQYTKGHSLRVSKYSVQIAKAMNFDEENLEIVKYAGLLHDIGKIGIPDSVLNKPDKLSEEEFEIIKSHTVKGASILTNLDSIPGAKDAANYHHERFDGNGYPQGLENSEIPLISRIICIADAYDAMNSTRVYRKKLSKEEILNELKKCSGTQFDPEILDITISLIEEGLFEE